MNEYKGKYIRFTQTHIDILDNVIQNVPGINNYADAVRYAVLSLEDNSNDAKKDTERKINAMSKNIDILIEMVAGGFHSQDVMAIGKSEDTYIYVDAKKNVENNIQRSTTMRSNSNESKPRKSIFR